MKRKLFVRAHDDDNKEEERPQMEDTEVASVDTAEYTTNAHGNELAASCRSNFQTSHALGEDIDVVLMKTDDRLIELETDEEKSTNTWWIVGKSL